MKLEDAIIEEGLKQKVEMAQLYKPATLCNESPTTGLQVENENVVFVIRDCAFMAKLYLPVEIFCRLEDPINSLRCKMNSTELKEFAKEVTEGVNVYKRVLYTMIFDYKPPVEQKRKKPEQIADVYGDYGELVNRCIPSGRQKTYEFTEVLAIWEVLFL